MGTPLEPPEDGLECSLCWGSAESAFGQGAPPATIQIEVTGIQKGTAWVPADGEPFDGVYSVPNVNNCIWTDPDFPLNTLRYTSGRSRFNIIYKFLFNMFKADIFEDCIKEFDNELTNPAFPFYGGHVSVLV